MVKDRVLGKLLLPSLLFLAACSGTVGLSDQAPIAGSPSAAEINAAAERAAAAEDVTSPRPTDVPASEPSSALQPAESNPAQTAIKTNRRVAVEGRPNVAWLIPYDGIRPV